MRTIVNHGKHQNHHLLRRRISIYHDVISLLQIGAMTDVDRLRNDRQVRPMITTAPTTQPLVHLIRGTTDAIHLVGPTNECKLLDQTENTSQAWKT